MRKALFVIVAALCFAAAYRFASHGIPVHDNKCIGLACAAVTIGILFLWLAFFKNRRQRDQASG